MPTLQLCLPSLEGLRRQILHRKHSRARVLRQQRGNSLGHERGNRLDPAGLLLLRSIGARQSAATRKRGKARLTQNAAVPARDQPDIRRDSAGQAFEPCDRAPRHQPRSHHKIEDGRTGAIFALPALLGVCGLQQHHLRSSAEHSSAAFYKGCIFSMSKASWPGSPSCIAVAALPVRSMLRTWKPPLPGLTPQGSNTIEIICSISALSDMRAAASFRAETCASSPTVTTPSTATTSMPVGHTGLQDRSLAISFNAMTGRGRRSATLQQKWASAPRTCSGAAPGNVDREGRGT